jgi:hypothetical protein
MPDKLHQESETHGWSRNIPDGHVRSDSPEYVASRKLMNALVTQLPDFLLGRAA